jgi:hypothetical protein
MYSVKIFCRVERILIYAGISLYKILIRIIKQYRDMEVFTFFGDGNSIVVCDDNHEGESWLSTGYRT